MNINMKYYIVTICAIFIALGVGILVGFNLNYDQALSKQQSEVLESFNTEFESLKNKNKSLQSEIDNLDEDVNTLKEFVDKNIDQLTQGVLTDKNTGIILTSENNDYSEKIEDLIEKANGTVSFNIMVRENINDKDKLDELSKKLNKEFKSSQEVLNYIVDSLSSPKGYDELYAMEDLGMIKINSIEENKYKDYDSVVLLGELDKKDAKVKFNSNEKVILDRLKVNDKYLVAVGESKSDNSILKLYSENKISTIDDIDEGIGQVSLINLLKDQNVVGNYGTSDISKELIAYKK